MNQQKINEAISAWFEPKPTNYDSRVSEKGFWQRRVEPNSKTPAWWITFDYFTDESANARLLEAMPRVCLRHYVDSEEPWACYLNGTVSDNYTPRFKERKTAVVLAFCKFAGIEVAGDGREG